MMEVKSIILQHTFVRSKRCSCSAGSRLSHYHSSVSSTSRRQTGMQSTIIPNITRYTYLKFTGNIECSGANQLQQILCYCLCLSIKVAVRQFDSQIQCFMDQLKTLLYFDKPINQYCSHTCRHLGLSMHVVRHHKAELQTVHSVLYLYSVPSFCYCILNLSDSSIKQDIAPVSKAVTMKIGGVDFLHLQKLTI